MSPRNCGLPLPSTFTVMIQKVKTCHGTRTVVVCKCIEQSWRPWMLHSRVVSLLRHSSCCCMRIKELLHWPGIEPGPPAWQARILPLNHQCLKDCKKWDKISVRVRWVWGTVGYPYTVMIQKVKKCHGTRTVVVCKCIEQSWRPWMLHSRVVSLLRHSSCCCMRIKELLHWPGIEPEMR